MKTLGIELFKNTIILDEELLVELAVPNKEILRCWDNAVVERFFGSLKYDWLLKVPQPTSEQMKSDVVEYMKYYNLERLHSANNDQSPVEYENSLRKVSGWS